MKRLLLVMCLAASACTTDSYLEGDGTQMTVKKAAGIPYEEEEVTTEVVPPGSELNPL